MRGRAASNLPEMARRAVEGEASTTRRLGAVWEPGRKDPGFQGAVREKRDGLAWCLDQASC
jgi:hypothetical protein